MADCLLSQIAIHVVETIDRLTEAVGHFKMVAESPIYHESRDRELQTHHVSP